MSSRLYKAALLNHTQKSMHTQEINLHGISFPRHKLGVPSAQLASGRPVYCRAAGNRNRGMAGDVERTSAVQHLPTFRENFHPRRHPPWRRLCATIDHVDNPPHNLNLVMVIIAATRRNGESPCHQKRENERHVESAGLSDLAKAKQCEARAKKVRDLERREWNTILARACRMLAEAESEVVARSSAQKNDRTARKMPSQSHALTMNAVPAL
jgi:hypothetical protein